jgi:hypothetical protein
VPKVRNGNVFEEATIPLHKLMDSERHCTEISLASRVGGIPNTVDRLKGHDEENLNKVEWRRKHVCIRRSYHGHCFTCKEREILCLCVIDNLLGQWTSDGAELFLSPWGQQAQFTSEYADAKREIKTLRSTRTVATFQK